MTTVVLNKWDGGQAEDVRTTDTDQNEESNNFDIFTEPFRLNPIPDSTADSADVAIDDCELSDVGICNISGTDYIVGVGYESAVSNAITFYTKSTPNGTFSKQASGTGNSYVKGSYTTYKTSAYGVDSNGSGTYRLQKFVSAGTVTTIGSISATANSPVRMFVHPEDNVLWGVVGSVIFRYDGSSLTTHTTILPANYYATGLTNYGGYLAIVVNPLSGNRNPTCLLWGRDTSLNTLQGTIDLGEGYCPIVENLDNNLVFVMSPIGVFSTTLQSKIFIKIYSGGTVQTIKELSDTGVSMIKAKKNNKLYFANSADCIWCFGKNKSGRYTITQDRYTINGTEIAGFPATSSVQGLSIIGDVMWVAMFNIVGVFSLQRTKIIVGEGLTYTATSKLTTTVNPNMPIGDRYKDKQLDAIQISFTGASSGITSLKYSVDGADFEAVIAENNTTGEHTVEATADANGAPLLSGREFRFQPQCTGGSKIKEVRYRYTVKETTV